MSQQVQDTEEEARIQIALQDSRVDVPFPLNVPIGEVLPELIPWLIAESKEQGKDTEWLTDRSAHWNLKKQFTTNHLDQEKSLHEQEVFDGNLLLLVKSDPGEKFIALFDDLAATVKHWFKEHFDPWDAGYAQLIALTTLPATTIFLCLAALLWTTQTHAGLLPRVVLIATLASLGTVTAAVATVLARAKDSEFSNAVIPLLVMTYALYATATLHVIDPPLGIYHMVFLGLLFPISIGLSMITGTGQKLHSAIATASLALGIVGVFNAFIYHGSPTAAIAAQLICVCIAVVLLTLRVSQSLARIAVPAVPSEGENFGSERAGDLDAGNLPMDQSGEAIESQFNQEKQMLAAHDRMVGLISAAMAVLCGAVFVAGRNLTNHHWLIMTMVLITVFVLSLRGKSHDDALIQSVFLVGSWLSMLLFATGMLLTGDPANAQHAGALLAALFAVVLVSALYALQQRRIASLTVLKMIELIERFLWVPLLPLLMLIMDGWQKGMDLL
ncbi:type VII secretion integral membrane protein EccD [Mycobacteroides abscessus]|uniref:type VII secretion integral membrane protein EccD n=1 Tax=Mycobacteroides abscessus TaxID=36809 RepID=UPI0009A7DF2C|nr:type VII secretion integral membrane protein EccD [Mycobacteroides abscessus]MBN7456683.1 type VII secretion integral membrane protein EccD [Mycobacteroides abscessus subsp. abscessus]SKU95139.1 type VII secretion integral membrane protein EccD [Mycobacteroides abscessus subsp. bolletii]SLC72838.1 type VII secretion integral membrane protein EccD [Mycobacteroides abscessus subsp. massiliense]SLJ50776.1 type VII secretion integral membrane protein EccD [Mycobacteroides abscessus subsp. absces